MTRTTYSRSAAAILTGASAPQVKKLSRELLKKRARGTGHHLGYTFDDLLRIAIAKELLRLGVQVASIYSLFGSIEKDWPRLRTPAAHTEGAALVLMAGLLGPNSLTGRAYLTTAAQVVARLQAKQTVVVIDIAALIDDLERRTGERYA